MDVAKNEAIPSNEELVERFRNGDEQAFDELSERMRPMVQQQVVMTRCSGADSDDLMQEGLLKDEVLINGEYRDIIMLGAINPKEQ